jgi:hypothetical protein
VSRGTLDQVLGLYLSPTGLLPSVAGLSIPLRLGYLLILDLSSTPEFPLVWALSLSLAAT